MVAAGYMKITTNIENNGNDLYAVYKAMRAAQIAATKQEAK